MMSQPEKSTEETLADSSLILKSQIVGGSETERTIEQSLADAARNFDFIKFTPGIGHVGVAKTPGKRPVEKVLVPHVQNRDR